MNNGFVRFALNFGIYLVLGGGVLSFVAMRGSQGQAPIDFSSVILAALVVALWSGGLTTVLEVVVMKQENALRRALLAAVVGGLSLSGFGAALSLVAWRAPSWSFIGIGFVAGAMMQAARAFSRGQRPVDVDAD